MAIKRMPIGIFVEGLILAEQCKDGYIMGARGQNPRKWSENSWWFTQYDDDKDRYNKAIYWRNNAERVWDCNGLAEGLYEEYTGVNINTKARYNYSDWCGIKGTGTIPVEYRVPGAAVFVHSASSGYITHVGYLEKPVDPSDPSGDWYIIEARGVMYGVVRTKLNTKSRGWNRWGLMTKYFDYENTEIESSGFKTLRNGCEGEDVKKLQESLVRLGYDCGKYGADGDFGDATEAALCKFQKDKNLTVNGVYNSQTAKALEAALEGLDATVENPTTVKIVGGQCYIRSEPNISGEKIATAKENSTHKFAGKISDNGWIAILYKNKTCWVSGKYGRLM